jgi:protein phosphatase methylesterase 1
MSNLYRSALSARLAKLPLELPPSDEDSYEDDEELEESDSLGSLPGSGLGPPAMCAYLRACYPRLLSI